MNWFQQNKFLGSFLTAFAFLALFALYFLLHEKTVAEEEATRLEATRSELNRLRRRVPFANEANLEKTRAQTENYRSSLGALTEELKKRTLPAGPLRPNEFQSQLRDSVNALTEKAAANKVRLPEDFYLGFEEYATSLPDAAAAPLLGRELKAVATLASAIVEAHVDALTSLTRAALPEEKSMPVAIRTPSRLRARRSSSSAIGSEAAVRADAVAIAFSASPAATRKLLNEIAIAREPLFAIHTLTVKNQVEKGPKRGAATATGPSRATPAISLAVAAPSLSFIVGNEHLNVAATIDIISLTPAAKEAR